MLCIFHFQCLSLLTRITLVAQLKQMPFLSKMASHTLCRCCFVFCLFTMDVGYSYPPNNKPTQLQSWSVCCWDKCFTINVFKKYFINICILIPIICVTWVNIGYCLVCSGAPLRLEIYYSKWEHSANVMDKTLIKNRGLQITSYIRYRLVFWIPMNYP